MSIAIPSPFVWDESFDVKDDHLNDQHKKLFNLISDLDANRNSAQHLKDLVDFVVKHFQDEEERMHSHNYDEEASHKQTHDKFLEDAGKIAAVNDDVIHFVKNWLVTHIKVSDFKYIGKI